MKIVRKPLLLFLASALTSAAFLGGGPVRAQIIEDDLPAESYTEIAYERLTLEELEARFSAAEAGFLESADPAAAVPAFTDLIEILEKRLAGSGAAPQERGLLVKSLAYRARINFNLGFEVEVDRDLERLLVLEPAFEFDPALVSPKLLQRFSALKKQRTATLLLTVDPPDAEVRVNGRPVDAAGGTVAVPAGALTVTALRPGYAPIEMPLEIQGGRRMPLDLVLERDSAMLLLVTRPVGATVLVDGQEAGETSGTLPLSYPLSGEAARHAREDFSAPLRIGGVSPGQRRIEVVKAGYRPYRMEVDVADLKDYNAGVVLLQKTEGVVVLRGLPRGARVTLDGEPAQALPINDADAQLRLPPGSYRIGVTDGTTGFFEIDLDLADRQTKQVAVELRPALTLLGVLGGDRPAARKLSAALEDARTGLEGWAFLDRSDEAEETLASLGFTAEALRSAGAASAGSSSGSARSSLPWDRLQAQADRRTPGSVYALAVLSDDLLATSADLWFLPTAPAPPRPDRKTVKLDDGGAIDQIVHAFNQPFALERAWFGALLVDSIAAEGPVVASLNPESPAAKAGVRVGDQILSIFGEKVTTAAEAQRQLEALRPGSSFSVELGSAAGRRAVDVNLGKSPAVVPLGSRDVIYAAVSAAVARASKDPESTAPAWLLQLNQGVIFLNGRAWEDAVRTLRAIQAPQGPGLGQAAVDYWLALALSAIGPEYYGQARQALERAAAVSGARLFHNDGPLVAPRARARLEGLGQNGG